MINSFTGKYRFLSNFYYAPIIFEGLVYPTTEHAYQAAKTLDLEEREFIRCLSNAGDAKKAGRRVTLRSDWEELKLAYMLEFVHRKFTGIELLKLKLLATGDKHLVEGNTWGDTYWGVYRGEGLNKLGEILMKVRGQIQESILEMKYE